MTSMLQQPRGFKALNEIPDEGEQNLAKLATREISKPESQDGRSIK